MVSRLGTGQDHHSCQEVLLWPRGQAPSGSPHSQPHQALWPTMISPTLQPTESPPLPGKEFPRGFPRSECAQARGSAQRWGRRRVWVELEEMFPRLLPHGWAPHTECPMAGCQTGTHGQIPTAGSPMAKHPQLGAMGVSHSQMGSGDHLQGHPNCAIIPHQPARTRWAGTRWAHWDPSAGTTSTTCIPKSHHRQHLLPPGTPASFMRPDPLTPSPPLIWEE